MSFNYTVACASAVSPACKANKTNFFFDSKSMKKGNSGTSTPLVGTGNSDSEQVLGVFEGVASPEGSFSAINCLRYFLKQKPEGDTDYIKQLKQFYTATNRLINGQEEECKNVSALVGFIRYNGFYFQSSGDILVYLYRDDKVDLLNPVEKSCERFGVKEVINPDPVYGEIQEGDRIVICTAGLKKSISNDNFVAYLSQRGNPQNCATNLLNEGMSRGITDCATVIILDVNEKTSDGYWILPSFIAGAAQTKETPINFSVDTGAFNAAKAEVDNGQGYTTNGTSDSGTYSDSNNNDPSNWATHVYDPVADNSYYNQNQMPHNRSSNDDDDESENTKKAAIIIAIVAGIIVLGALIAMLIISNSSNGKTNDTSNVDSLTSISSETVSSADTSVSIVVSSVTGDSSDSSGTSDSSTTTTTASPETTTKESSDTTTKETTTTTTTKTPETTTKAPETTKKIDNSTTDVIDM